MNISRLSHYKHILILVISLLSGLGLKAQETETPEAEFSFYLKGPFHKLNFDLGDLGENTSRFGVGLGVQYARYLDSHWSVSAALEYQSYRSKTILSDFSDSYMTTDVGGESFEFQYSVDYLYERDNLSLFNIPIRVQYETETIKTIKFYGSAGFAVGFPISGKYKNRVQGLKTAAYYPQWDALLNSPRFMGFGNWGNRINGKMDFDAKNSYAFLLEAGIKHNLSEKHNFYGGFFVDIPLNKINKNGDGSTSMIAYDTENPTKFRYNPVFYSSTGGEGDGYADKIKAVALGFKLRFAIGY